MTQHTQDTLYLLDSYGLIYRSYFAFVSHPLTNKAGENVSALYGFFRSLAMILKTYRPQYFLAAFDSRTPTFRHEWYPEYKATRDKTPEDLHAQIPHIEKILTTLGIACLRKDGFEADDIIATLACRAAQEGRRCVIISGDKDLAQLVGEFVSVLKPDKSEALAHCGIEEVKEHWGVAPAQMLDYLSLIGDASDNVPGVKGIGPKTAVKLLQDYGTLDAVYEHIDSIAGAVQKKLAAGKESAYFSKKLITLAADIPIEGSIEDYRCDALHYTEAAALLKEYELPRLGELYTKAAEEAGMAGAAAAPNTAAAGGSAGSSSVENGSGTGDAISRGKAASSAGTGTTPAELRKNTGEYRTVTDAAELEAVIAEAEAQGFAAFDCETTGLNPLYDALIGFSLSLKAGTGIYVPLKAPAPELGEQPFTVMPLAAAKKLLARLWSNESLTLILHNGKFDYQVLRTAKIFTSAGCRLFDTMIAAWLLEPDNLSFGLENLAEAQLGLQGINYKDVVPKGRTFAAVPLPQATEYAAEDADFTLQLYHLYKPALEQANLTALFETLEMPLMPLLADMEAQGIFLKKEELAAFSEELADTLARDEAEIYKLVGHPFNIASPKQLQEVLFTERKLPTGKKTKTGYSTDISVLEELATIDELPAKILDYRASAKLKSGYADALPLLADTHGRIHTSFIQTGTATGRLSSRDPNLQNIPIRGEEGRKIRKAFYAADGCKLISADYAQIELVILAHFSQDENLVKAFRHGTDVHAATAALIFNVPVENVVPDMRRIAKVINFGVMYGMSAFRLANQLRISRTEAAEFITRYFTTYSGVSAFMETLKESAAEKGFVETLMGRRRYINAINSRNQTQRAAAERIAINTPIQGSAADIVKTAMLRVDRALKQQQLKARLLLQVHDELILEAPDAEVDTVKALLKQEMEHVVELAVPLRVSIEAGSCWGDFH
ncbi:DNA polymerase I [Treponema sp. OMZ 838]|uniref:DNA polymerase I n=1 Tax=Treponema sp. OMZ 838 TaxID=1539298 RepID=UPI0005301500|nr:DNA polymerase I [Treponema sp. OMZ 838]AIW90264.1 DNA polymerase I [Treponema sp. OMZ 838]